MITFNAEQQSLILDLLDEIRRRDSELEWFFADEREEPVIVKNLENIQGDERDVMLFSVTFGPDHAGKLTMNFGPINGTGGEKRLNVAITRARRELHVFSSIRAEQIDLDRTRAVGVRDLKAFIDYAERGSIALSARDEGSLGPAESPFEEAVADAFRAKGWEVRTQIGVSGFRVDLGVVHPDYAGSYLAGIECDGATYHSSATARDRDKVRQAMLEDLGWRIRRVWSTDWFRNPSHVTDRIHRELGCCLKEDQKVRVPVEDEADEQETEAELPGESGNDAEIVQLVSSESEHDQAAEDAEGTAATKEEPPRLTTAPDGVSGTALSTDLQTYQSWRGVAPDPRTISTTELADTLREIIEMEGPIVTARLYRAYRQASSLQKVGRQVRTILNRGLADLERRKIVTIDRQGIDKGYKGATIRIANSPEIVLRDRGDREFAEIPIDELARLYGLVQSESPGEDKESIRRKVLSRYGLIRMTANVRDRLDEAVQRL